MTDGQLEEPGWRGGPTELSQACGTNVVPAALNARNSRAYYQTRRFARIISGGNTHFGAMIGSLRYFSETWDKLGGAYEVVYGPPCPPGTPRAALKQAAEGLVPGLYVSDSSGSSNSSG